MMAGSSVKSRPSGSRASAHSAPSGTATPIAIRVARQPACIASGGRPAPRAWPTSVEAATPNPVPGIHENARIRTPTV